MRIEVEYQTLPRHGETMNGDAALVRQEGSNVLLAVVDALGHGEGAAQVAKAAIDVLSNMDTLLLLSRISSPAHLRPFPAVHCDGDDCPSMVRGGRRLTSARGAACFGFVAVFSCGSRRRRGQPDALVTHNSKMHAF